MGKFSRDKGKRGEREVVALWRELGYNAERTAPLQSGLKNYPDVIVDNTLSIEVKRRKVIPAYIVPSNADMVMVRGDRQDWLVVVHFSMLPYICKFLRGCE